MIHNYSIEGHIDPPINDGNVYLPGIGNCTFRVKPFEDDELPPRVYLVNIDTQEELCSLRLLEPIIEPDILTNEQKKIITEYINEKHCPIGQTYVSSYFILRVMWMGMNGPEDRDIIFPKESPKYYI